MRSRAAALSSGACFLTLLMMCVYDGAQADGRGGVCGPRLHRLRRSVNCKKLQILNQIGLQATSGCGMFFFLIANFNKSKLVCKQHLDLRCFF